MYLVKKLPETVVKWQIHRFVCFFTHKTILYYFFGRKKLFLSITNFSPDFYQLARLAEQNNSFFAKYLTNFSPIQYVYNGRSPFVVEKNNIYLKKKKFVFTSRGPRIFGFISRAVHFSCNVGFLFYLKQDLVIF